MDEFFEGNLQLWNEPPAPLKQSDFVPFRSGQIEGLRFGIGANGGNMNKRMVEFMRKRFPGVTVEAREYENGRGYRHKMSERMRRERQKQSYLALHSLLAIGTKKDKNSIVQAAKKEIQELQHYKEQVQKRNNELQSKLHHKSKAKNQVNEADSSTKIRFKVNNPKSGIESMIQVLKCLKNMESNPISIQSQFSDNQLLAVLDINTQIGAGEVEKTVQRTLYEAERKFLYHSLEISNFHNPNILS